MILDKADKRQTVQSTGKVRKLPPGFNHRELVEEMRKAAKLPMERRLAIAKERRKEQLQWYYAKQAEERSRSKDSARSGSARRCQQKRVQFEPNSLLFSLVSEGDVDGVRNLITSKRCNKDATNCYGVTALHQACINHNLGMIHVLVKELYADISKPDLELWTPLHTVALLGFADVAKFLLDNGADPLVLNLDMNMPYDICDDTLQTLNIIEMSMVERGVTQERIEELRMKKEFQMLRELEAAFEQDNSLMDRGSNDESLLHVSASLGFMEVTNFLLSKTSISIDDVDGDGWQAIHCAAYWNQLKVVELLMEHGASVFSKTPEDETALDLCRDETMREWMQEKVAQDSHCNVKKASSVRRDNRRCSTQDQLGSSHFDSFVSLTDINKYSLSSKLLNAEMKEAKKKRDVKLEYQSLLTLSTDPPSECIPSPSSSPPTWMSRSPPVFHSCPESYLAISGSSKREITRSQSSLNDYILHPSSRSQSTSSSNCNNPGNLDLSLSRTQTSYISVYNNQLGQYTQLDSPSTSPRDNPFKQSSLSPAKWSYSPSPMTPRSTPASTKDKLIFVFPTNESSATNNWEDSRKKKRSVQKERPSSKKEKPEVPTTIRSFQMFPQPSESQKSHRTGSLTSSKVESFIPPKRMNSSNDMSKFSAIGASTGDSDGKSGGKSWNKKGTANNKCVIS